MLQVTGLQVAGSKKTTTTNLQPAEPKAQPATCNTKSNLLLFVKKVVTCRTIT